jgi:hypothetical protein
VNDNVLARRELAFETAADFGDVDADGAGENAVLRDLYDAAVHGRLDPPLDHQCVAIGDFNAAQLDVGSDDQLAADGLFGLRRRFRRRGFRKAQIGARRLDDRRLAPLWLGHRVGSEPRGYVHRPAWVVARLGAPSLVLLAE